MGMKCIPNGPKLAKKIKEILGCHVVAMEIIRERVTDASWDEGCHHTLDSLRTKLCSS